MKGTVMGFRSSPTARQRGGEPPCGHDPRRDYLGLILICRAGLDLMVSAIREEDLGSNFYVFLA